MSETAQVSPLVEDALACSILRWSGDTRAARLYRDLRVAFPSEPLLQRLAARLLPENECVSAVHQARARARDLLAASEDGGPLVFASPMYPDRLSTLADPPIALWTTGHRRALASDGVAVVGSRRATAAGIVLARRLARDLAAAGITIVSGLARGIDAAGHEGALEADGTTVAVLGCGVDVAYPRQHRVLMTRIVQRGCLVSELPPGTAPLAQHFPLRNRIISGLASAVLVVEAAERSGSLITARAALDQGRDVLAVPGSVVSGCHRGCHALIKDGAGLVETADDVLAALGWRYSSVVRPKSQPSGIAARMTVGEPVTVDRLAGLEGRPAPAVLAELGRLEVAGLVARTPDGQFVRLD